MAYSKEDVKDNIDMEDIYNLLDFFSAEPQMFNDHIVAKTICHGGDSSKMYWYANSGLFQCFSDSCGSFDVIELVQKVKMLDFNSAIYFLVNFFNLQWKLTEKTDIDYSLEDWKIFDHRNKLDEIEVKDSTFHRVQLEKYDVDVIKNYPRVRIPFWEKEHIPKEISDYMGIKYDPLEGCLIIPHYDENNRCVGIRKRTLVREDEKNGKYRPWWHGTQQYNHALAFNLYGMNISKKNIQKAELAIVVESEKSFMQLVNYLGLASVIGVAVCGSSLSKYQFELLQSYGAKEIVVAFDKDYHDGNDIENYNHFVDKLKRINNKFGAKCNLSFIVDTDDMLGYKNSPTDKGKNVFFNLFRNRRYMKTLVD